MAKKTADVTLPLFDPGSLYLKTLTVKEVVSLFGLDCSKRRNRAFSLPFVFCDEGIVILITSWSVLRYPLPHYSLLNGRVAIVVCIMYRYHPVLISSTNAILIFLTMSSSFSSIHTSVKSALAKLRVERPHTRTMQENRASDYRGTYLSQPFNAVTYTPICSTRS